MPDGARVLETLHDSCINNYWMKKRLLPVLLALATLVSTGVGEILYRCTLDGIVRTECCCEDSFEVSSHEAMETESCCDVRTNILVERPTPVPASPVSVVGGPSMATVWVPMVPSSPSVAPVLRTRAHGPPIYTVFCSYLI